MVSICIARSSMVGNEKVCTILAGLMTSVVLHPTAVMAG
jgi:hypothetical protein